MLKYESFTTHQMLIRTYQMSVKDCTLLTKYTTFCMVQIFFLNV